MERIMASRLKLWAFGASLIATLLFVLAGTWRDPWLWAYVCVWTSTALYAFLGIDDDLAKERFRPPTASADRVGLRFIRLSALTHFVVGALDTGRWHLIAPMPSVARALGLALMAAGLMMFYRAMRENQFFSAVVRIQADRGHRVVDTGPYSIVRHPGDGLVAGCRGGRGHDDDGGEASAVRGRILTRTSRRVRSIRATRPAPADPAGVVTKS
jgi:hypothetical protein